jgi:hypothetical protein
MEGVATVQAEINITTETRRARRKNINHELYEFLTNGTN